MIEIRYVRRDNESLDGPCLSMPEIIKLEQETFFGTVGQAFCEKYGWQYDDIESMVINWDPAWGYEVSELAMKCPTKGYR